MSAEAAIYRGSVRHRRVRGAAPSDFTHPISFLYGELTALPQALGGRLVRRGPGLVRVRPSDLHGRGDSFAGVRDAVRATVAELSGRPAPTGAVTVLTQPRVLGMTFNPVSFYYLFDDAGELDAVLAEVTSTPWRERRPYVLRAGDDHAELQGTHEKTMRVSPFQPLAQEYRWRVSAPEQALRVSIVNAAQADGEADLVAGLHLEREELSPRTLRAMQRRQPGGTLRTLALIYGHAVGLKLRGAKIHSRRPLASEGGGT